MCRVVISVVLIICVLQSEGQSEGDSCDVGGVNGKCKNINNCPAALAGLKDRVRPKICFFSNSDPVVCCVEPGAGVVATSTTTTTTQRVPVTTTSRPNKTTSTTEYTPDYGDYEVVSQAATCAPIPPSLTAAKTGQKAWDKCVEYQEKYVYPCKSSLALSGGMDRVFNCKHNANELIINGVDAKEAEFPHMAMLGFGERNAIDFQCGGTIISESFILTAGHCTYARILGPVTFALVGTLRRSARPDPELLYGVARIHKHIEYAPPSRYNDVALLETDRRIKLSSSVVPACLDTGHQQPAEALATGWGTLVNGSLANVLQKVKIFKISNAECARKVGVSRVLKRGIDENMQICFGDTKESHDTCQGDSGGPLQINHSRIKCMYVVIGVTSFGRQCGVVGEPGLYSRVQHYLPWIESVVWP